MTVSPARLRIQPGRIRKSTYNIVGLFFLIILFLYGFFLGRSGIPSVAGEPVDEFFWQEFQERTGKTNWLWATGSGKGEAFYLTYRPWDENDRYTLGKVPLVAVVNFWNPVKGLTCNELASILRGEITNWQQVGGEDRPVTVYFYSGQKYPYLANLFPKVTPEAVLLSSQPELRARVAADPSGISLITPQAAGPTVKALALEGINPFWDSVQNYPLTAAVALVPPAQSSFSYWAGGGFLREYRLRTCIKKAFIPGEQLAETVTLAAAGDILLDRAVARTMRKLGDNRYPLLRTAPIFRRADLAFANLECPLSTRGRQINMFRGKPEYVETLTYGGFNLISLANNHILDYGVIAMLDTMEHLSAAGIVHAGVGENIFEARRPQIFEIKGVKVAFLAYTEVGEGITYTRVPLQWAATPELPGAAQARADFVRLDVKTARQEADLVILSMHWGKEYDHRPTDFQKALGRIAVDAGADLVIGHHPHVIQGIEFRGRGVIAYSLGNFIFDQETLNRRQGLILKAAFDRGGLRQLAFTPVLIVQGQPQVATGDTGRKINNLLTVLSEELANGHGQTGDK